MEKLPKSQWEMELFRDKRHVIASIYSPQDGVRWWHKYELCDLPNDDIVLNDLERFGIHPVNMKSFRCDIPFLPFYFTITTEIASR
jgi:hypothetical protein